MARDKTKEELEKEFRVKSESYERKLKNKNSKFIIVSVTIIVLGYLFFLLSPKLFHEKPERYYTDIGSSVSFSGGSITPSSWVITESGKMMQVEFTFKSNQAIAPDIEVNAATSYDDRTKASSRLNSEIIYHEGEYYIANIYNIPDDYYCVSLRVRTVVDENAPNNSAVKGDGLGNDVVNQLSETQNQGASETAKSSTAVIYTCSDAIDTVQALYRLDDYIYRIKRIQSNITLDYISISENNTKIETLKNSNTGLELKNDELREAMIYMTSSEKAVNEREIESNNNTISDNISQITTLEASNTALQTEISEYSEIIKRIAAEGEGRTYIAPTENEQATELSANPTDPQQTTTEQPSQPSTQPQTQPATQKAMTTKK